MNERIILGIDPGTTVTGYGLIRAGGKEPEILLMGVLKLNKYSNHYLKLQKTRRAGNRSTLFR